MTRKRLTTHFAAAEFDCRNGAGWPPGAREALEEWCRLIGEPLRAEFGPVTVLSGYRDRAHNAAVGGAPQSYHRWDLRYGPTRVPALGRGLACDVRCARGGPRSWSQYLIASSSGRKLRSRGLGAFVPYAGSGFVHADTGPARSWAG